jgi:heterodisulfide reductase subunit A-like polyferredoxin
MVSRKDFLKKALTAAAGVAADPAGVFGSGVSPGVAVVDTSACLAYNGSTCMTCYDACPLKRTALRFSHNRPVVDAITCDGCGECHLSCPAYKKGIVIEPR